ncbi:MAG: cation:proton antiporter [Alphaproteobacteria bacterium]|nr:cation:proton antiporter [Alphaproteobacteria bacterium]
MNSVILGVLGISALLVAVSIVVPVARRLQLPYTLVLAGLGCLVGLLGYLKLTAVGLGGEIAGGLREIGLLDDAFIYVFLPPLLFSAGLTVDIRHILDDIGYVVLLAFVAVLLCTVFVGYGLDLATSFGLLPCLLLGTIVSTTDTAAVINIFREAGAPKRLSAIVEGEALFNDAAAIALFGLFLDMVTQGKQLDLIEAARDFLLALMGGAAFGYAMARVCGWLISLLQDSVTTEVTLTIALAYFTFVVSNEVLGISGVVATVTLATFVGSGSRTRVSPGSWEILHNVWEHLDFWATSFIFIISAMYIPRSLTTFSWSDAVDVAVVFVAALASRAVVIGGMMPTFSAIGASKPLRRAYKIVLWWGGMRGAVTVALALATTATDGVPEPVRHLITSSAVGYVIASLVLNGLTLRPLMKLLRLDKFNEVDHALRSRMVMLARRRIKKELNDVAAAVGFDADELSKAVVPHDKGVARSSKSHVGLPLVLDTWCHHELDTVLAFRERGLITRHHADMLRAHADRLLNSLRNGEAEGYADEVERLRRPGALIRGSFELYRRFGWSRWLRAVVSARMEYLVAEMLLIRDLIGQCDEAAARLFGRELAEQLRTMLGARLAATEDELKSIEAAYPKFAGVMHRRYLALVALGLVEAEYRRHLSEATISADVFEDLDAQRRAIASGYVHTDARSSLEDFDTVHLLERLPLLDDFPQARSCVRPHPVYPGEALMPGGQGRVYFVAFGTVRGRDESGERALEAGSYFGAKKYFRGCRPVSEAFSAGYSNLLAIDWPRLRSLMRRNPELKAALESGAKPASRNGRSRRRAAQKAASAET